MGTAARNLAAIGSLEDVRQIVGRNSFASIDYLYGNSCLPAIAAYRGRMQQNHANMRRMEEGVLKQIIDDTLYLAGIHQDSGQIFVRVADQQPQQRAHAADVRFRHRRARGQHEHAPRQGLGLR